MESLFRKYSTLLCLDFETTGLYPNSDEIIDFGLCRVIAKNGQYIIEKVINELMKTSTGLPLPSRIVEITGITDEMLALVDKSRKEVIESFVNIIDKLIKDDKRVLIMTYNAHFDLGFLEREMKRYGYQNRFKNCDYLDILTIYKDRKPYPHRLEDAIRVFNLSDIVKNSHRAYDDASAAAAVLEAMSKTYDDMDKYINLFGYNPNFGLPKNRIANVTYKQQPYKRTKKLYE